VSSYRGNHEACPHCGVRYGRFRTGFTYHEVYHMMWQHPQKRRNTILGSWHQLKKELWSRHVETDCPNSPRSVAAMQEVPF
jgi:hypothetical protein